MPRIIPTCTTDQGLSRPCMSDPGPVQPRTGQEIFLFSPAHQAPSSTPPPSPLAPVILQSVQERARVTMLAAQRRVPLPADHILSIRRETREADGRTRQISSVACVNARHEKKNTGLAGIRPRDWAAPVKKGGRSRTWDKLNRNRRDSNPTF